MIVRYTAEGWEVITQRNHGLLAAEICARWKITNQPNRWVETLVACCGHDDAFNELEEGPLVTAQGGPVNFDMNSFDERLSRLLINMALTRSAFSALLTAHHIVFTHGSEPKAKTFIAELQKKKSAWMKSAKTTANEIVAAYQLLEFCDAFSLIICQDILPPESRKMEISNGPDGKPYEVFTQGNILKVAPWPFETKAFEVSYEIRKLTKIQFVNDQDFRENLYRTIPELIIIKLSN